MKKVILLLATLTFSQVARAQTPAAAPKAPPVVAPATAPQTPPAVAPAPAARQAPAAQAQPKGPGILEGLILAAMIGFGSATLTRLLRSKLGTNSKLLNCDNCMTTWASIALGLLWWWNAGAMTSAGLLLWFATVILAGAAVGRRLIQDDGPLS